MRVFALKSGTVLLIVEEADGMVEVSVSRHKNGLAFTPEMAAKIGADLIACAAEAAEVPATQNVNELAVLRTALVDAFACLASETDSDTIESLIEGAAEKSVNPTQARDLLKTLWTKAAAISGHEDHD